MNKEKTSGLEGVLFIRYKNNTREEMVIEKLKKVENRSLNQRIIRGILLFEGIEILDANELNQDIFRDLCSLCFDNYSDKLKLCIELSKSLFNVQNKSTSGARKRLMFSEKITETSKTSSQKSINKKRILDSLMPKF